MRLLTKEIKLALPKLYATEEIPLENKIVICKFFTPRSDWSWFVFEGEAEEDDDYRFFGMVNGFANEMGCFHFI